MPLSTTLRKLVCCAPGRQEEEAEAPARRPRPEPAQAARPRPEPAQAARPRPEPAPAGRRWPDPAPAAAVEPGRPYRDFVEDEAREFWQEMVQAGRLTKPDLQEIRTAAIPVLGLAQRGRPGRKINPALNRAQMAVDAMHLHALERRWIKPPYTGPQASGNYVEALIQLADDAGWLAREIPLPAHRGPQHPPIYFTLDPVSKQAVPREDALIRGDYVYNPIDGCRITEDEYIFPWRDLNAPPAFNDLVSRDRRAFYTFSTRRIRSREGDKGELFEQSRIMYSWIKEFGGLPRILKRPDRIVLSTRFGYCMVMGIHFSPLPPSREDFLRYRYTRDLIIRNSYLSVWPRAEGR